MCGAVRVRASRGRRRRRRSGSGGGSAARCRPQGRTRTVPRGRVRADRCEKACEIGGGEESENRPHPIPRGVHAARGPKVAAENQRRGERERARERERAVCGQRVTLSHCPTRPGRTHVTQREKEGQSQNKYSNGLLNFFSKNKKKTKNIFNFKSMNNRCGRLKQVKILLLQST